MTPTLRRAWAARERWTPPLAMALVVTATLAVALTAPINHDEDQYVAAAALAAHGRLPIVDFVYLQTPLQAWVLAPVVTAFPAAPLLAARIACALFGAAACLAGGAVVRAAGGSRAHASATACVIAASPIVQVAFQTARNDALPCALAVLGFALLVRMDAAGAEGPGRGGGGGRAGLAAGAGLATGFALCAKLTFVFAPAAAALWLVALALRRRVGVRELVAFAAGGGLGVLPAAALAAAAPEAFAFDVVGLHKRLTPLWWARNGLSDRLAPDLHAAFWGAMLAQDAVTLCALAVLCAAAWRAVRRPSVGAAEGVATVRRRAIGLVGPATALALAAAWQPSPSFTAYAAPPFLLAILLAALAGAGLEGRLRAAAAAALVGVAALAGGGSALQVARAAASPGTLGLVRLARTADEVRAALRGARPGAVVSLTPMRVLQAGRPIEPGLAAGSVVFRVGEAIPVAQARRLHALTPATLEPDLAASHPVAILTGFETEWPVDPEGPLVAYARAHGFAAHALTEGMLWIAPDAGSPARTPAPQ